MPFSPNINVSNIINMNNFIDCFKKPAINVLKIHLWPLSRDPISFQWAFFLYSATFCRSWLYQPKTNALFIDQGYLFILAETSNAEHRPTATSTQSTGDWAVLPRTNPPTIRKYNRHYYLFIQWISTMCDVTTNVITFFSFWKEHNLCFILLYTQSCQKRWK